uniref:Uncharacterized protein n=1 Tax=viral metagenome TaxID=1070528 RepID=A0A6C0J617_9ZZZZ
MNNLNFNNSNSLNVKDSNLSDELTLPKYKIDYYEKEELKASNYDLEFSHFIQEEDNQLENQNFLPPIYNISFSNVNKPVRNANLQLRSEPPNPQVLISPWVQSTIEPDINRKPFEIHNSKDELKKIENFKSEKSVPCSDNLSDNEYLTHMIPHHQVAVDISLLLQEITKNPTMQKILRELIWTQRYEINLMKEMLNNLPYNISSNKEMNRNYLLTISDLIEPNKINISNTYCDPHFFNPEEHMKHLKHMKLDDKMYLKHMIPHHQVAVDMSKKLLKNTKNDFMIYLAYRIIKSQASEIIMLSDLLKNNNNFYKSKILN